MTTFFDLFASIALFLPGSLPGFPADAAAFVLQNAAAPESGAVSGAEEDVWAAAGLPAGGPLLTSPQAGTTAPLNPAGIAPLGTDVWDQVRIEQQVIIRVTPRNPGRDAAVPRVMPMQPVLQQMVPPPRSASVRVRERKAGKCMPATGIAAVQPITDGRLMFYMRDRRMLAAGLEKACSARDFYQGFYMSKTADGQLCVGRDAIHSRAGTTCKLKEVREYVPAAPADDDD